MPTYHKAVMVPPDRELGLMLKTAQTSGKPVIVDTGEDCYTLIVALTKSTGDVFAHYDPQAVIAAPRALDDAFVGVDREQLLRELHDQRGQDSQGRPA